MYIDDYGGWCVIPKNEEEYRLPEEDLAAVKTRLKSKGLGSHKEFVSLPRMLGYEVVEEVCPRTSRSVYILKGEDIKLTRLTAATLYIIRRRKCSPQIMSQVVGGWTWMLLTNRALLSIFDEVYTFTQDHWDERFRFFSLSDAVLAELNTLIGCLPFARAELSIPFSDRIYVVDAGPQWNAILDSPASKEEQRVLARLAERGGWLLHETAELDALGEPIERGLQPFLTAEKLFDEIATAPPQEVPEKYFDPSRWSIKFWAWNKDGAHNTVRETLCIEQAVRHFSSSIARWHSRLVVISDAGAAIGCISKGRSSSYHCNRICRRVASIVCMSNLRVYCRWVASAHNVADGPSRGMRVPGVAPETMKKIPSSAGDRNKKGSIFDSAADYFLENTQKVLDAYSRSVSAGS